MGDTVPALELEGGFEPNFRCAIFGFLAEDFFLRRSEAQLAAQAHTLGDLKKGAGAEVFQVGDVGIVGFLLLFPPAFVLWLLGVRQWFEEPFLKMRERFNEEGPRRHMRDKAGLAATGGSFQQHRQAMVKGMLEQLALIAQRLVERQRAAAALLHGTQR